MNDKKNCFQLHSRSLAAPSYSSWDHPDPQGEHFRRRHLGGQWEGGGKEFILIWRKFRLSEETSYGTLPIKCIRYQYTNEWISKEAVFTGSVFCLNLCSKAFEISYVWESHKWQNAGLFLKPPFWLGRSCDVHCEQFPDKVLLTWNWGHKVTVLRTSLPQKCNYQPVQRWNPLICSFPCNGISTPTPSSVVPQYLPQNNNKTCFHSFHIYSPISFRWNLFFSFWHHGSHYCG